MLDIDPLVTEVGVAARSKNVDPVLQHALDVEVDHCVAACPEAWDFFCNMIIAASTSGGRLPSATEGFGIENSCEMVLVSAPSGSAGG